MTASTMRSQRGARNPKASETAPPNIFSSWSRSRARARDKRLGETNDLFADRRPELYGVVSGAGAMELNPVHAGDAERLQASAFRGEGP